MKWSRGLKILTALAVGVGVSSAQAALWPQQLNIHFKEGVVGLLQIEVRKAETRVTVKSITESMPGGKLMENPVRVTFSHDLGVDWVWQRSTIVNPRLSPFPFDVRLEGGNVLYEMRTSTGFSRHQLPASGKIMPRQAFFAYLSEAAPRELMIEKELLILDEDTMTLRRISWTFLGAEGRGSNRVAKFEIKGDLKMVLRIDSKGRLRSIKDMDLGLFYEN